MKPLRSTTQTPHRKSAAHTVSLGLASTLCLSLLAGACSDVSTYPEEWAPQDVDGSQSRVTFQTASDTNDTSYLQRKLAVNASMMVKTSRAVTSATSSNADVFTADLRSGVIHIEAKSEGSANLEVALEQAIVDQDMTNTLDMLANSESNSDSLTIGTAIAQHVELKNLCGQADLAALTGRTDIFLGYELQDAAGNPLAGSGYYPFDAQDDRITLSPSPHQELVHLTTLAQTGSVTISSRLDEQSWNLQLFGADAIDGAMVHGHRNLLPRANGLDDLLVYARRFNGETLNPGTTHVLHAEPTVQGLPLCMADLPMFVESLTPERCSILSLGIDEQTHASGDFDAHDESYSLFAITTESEITGDCKFAITYPQGNNGQGVTTTITLPVVERPQPVMVTTDMDTFDDMGYDSEDMPDSGIDMEHDMEQAQDLSPEFDMDEVDMTPDMDAPFDMATDGVDMP